MSNVVVEVRKKKFREIWSLVLAKLEKDIADEYIYMILYKESKLYS